MAHILFLLGLIVAPFSAIQSRAQTPIESLPKEEVLQQLILARTPNIPAIKNTGQFADVEKGHPYEAYLLYAESLRLIEADANGQLHPGSIVSRAEFLKMLGLLFNLPEDTAHPFRDVEKDSWYAPYAGIARTHLLFEGSESRHLYPFLPVTNAEVQDAIQRVTTSLQRQERGRGVLDETGIQTQRNTTKLYTVSTKRLNVPLIYPTVEPAESVSIRRIAIPPSLPRIRTDVLNAVNAERKKLGLQALTYDDRLEQSAQKYAEDMATRNFFNHVSPEGYTLRDRLTETGYNKRIFSPVCNCIIGFSMGENLARGQKDVAEVMRDWLNSKQHKEAILNPDYTDIGVGMKNGYWVQHFGGVLVP